MAEFLGKPRLTRQDLREYWLRHEALMRHFLDADKPRIVAILPHDLYEKFEKAVIKKYGSISYSKVSEAARNAIKFWSESTLEEDE